MRKPPITERNRIIRLQWAEEHVGWTGEQWNSILWTDEIWITGGWHTRTWVTRRAGEEWGIEVIYWPPFSPDLNPIEKVWHIMKNYLQDNFSENMSYDRLRDAVKEAWGAVGQHEFRELIESMPAQCQAVIEANGLFTKY